MNLFNQTARMRAVHCFSYNNMILFVVPRSKVSKAIGENNSNLKRIGGILSKRIRIVAEPQEKTKSSIASFITTIISPVQYKSIDIKEGELTITAGGIEQRARLIGRERIRQKELQNILEQYFGIKVLKIA